MSSHNIICLCYDEDITSVVCNETLESCGVQWWSQIWCRLQWRIQDLRLGGGGGGLLFYELELHPPLERFSWSHYQSLCLDFLGFRIAPPHEFFSEATIKVYTYLCISSEATIKVYTWIIFFCSHYKSLYLNFLKGGARAARPPPPLDPPLDCHDGHVYTCLRTP